MAIRTREAQHLQVPNVTLSAGPTITTSDILRRRAEVDMGTTRLGRTHDATLLVLTSLTGGPKHGYGLIQDIEEMAGVSLGPGTLYGVLARLEEEGLIRALAPSGRRRPYCITAQGAAVLRERLQVAATMARVGLRRLGAAT